MSIGPPFLQVIISEFSGARPCMSADRDGGIDWRVRDDRAIRIRTHSVDGRSRSRSGRLAMSGELNFEAMPFGAYETVAPEQSGFELEEEFGRGARSRSRPRGFAPRVMPKRPGPPPAFRPGTRKKPPVYPPRFPRFPPRWPWRPVGGYGVVPEPYPAEPLPAGSDPMRCVH